MNPNENKEKYIMKWQLLLEEDEVSEEDWDNIKDYLKAKSIKYHERRVCKEVLHK